MAEILVEPIENYALKTTQNTKTLFSKIGVVGCGKEGQSIVRIAAWNGIEVTFVEQGQGIIDTALAGISAELDNRIEHWGLTQSEKKAIMARIKGTVDYKDLANCDFVIEAIRYNDHTGMRSIEMRKQVFHDIEAVVAQDAIIATNATTVVISELASELKHPERCISLHFFVTSPEARIIEVVRGLYTTDEVFEKVSTFVKLINRQVIPVAESAGLISVRLFIVLLNEACHLLMEGIATKEDIDKTVIAGMGTRFGVFRMADIIGLGKVVRWMDNLYEEFGDPKYKPSHLIKRLVRSKLLGVQTGEGFYRYDENGKPVM
ncbi:MAG: hypothetical protein LBV41_05410 [Cytophagaceae bacterium]|jgi:3-hydroxybutyryl-CoA dehydrogenase|nr:hypothetical protein [Cytophagaceae bacterium]